jgi:VanZ family protein
LPAPVRRFFLLGLLTMLGLFAFGIEAVQIFLPARTPALSDSALYFIGAVLGIWLAGHFTTDVRRHDSGSPRNPASN